MMKRLLLACSLIGVIAAAHAQPEHHAMLDAQQRSAQLQKSLQLSDEQTAKIKTIFDNNEQRRHALMEKYKPQLEAFHAEQKALHEQMHTQLSGVLTPKQLQAMEQQCEGHGGMHGKAGPAAADEHNHDESAAE